MLICVTIKVPNRTRARRYSGQEFYKSFEKYKVWKLTILARLGGMLCVFNSLARLGVCCVFSIAFLDFYAQHVYNLIQRITYRVVVVASLKLPTYLEVISSCFRT